MEEKVGKIWDQWIQKKAHSGYPEAQVFLEDISSSLAISFRALGGHAALKLCSESASVQKTARTWLQKLAGTGQKIELSWVDDEALVLPEVIDIFPEKQLNFDCYLWLCMQFSIPKQNNLWFLNNLLVTQKALSQWTGFSHRYQRLVNYYLAQRTQISMPLKFQNAEKILTKYLQDPFVKFHNIPDSIEVSPVLIWPHPNPPQPDGVATVEGEPSQAQQGVQVEIKKQHKRYKSKRVKLNKNNDGIMLYRFESIFSRAEHANVNREIDEDPDDNPEKIVDDLDELAITRAESGSGRLKFDLDLPSEQAAKLGKIAGILLPEWDFKLQQLKKDFCRVVETSLSEELSNGCSIQLKPLHPQLIKDIRQVRRQLSSLMPQRAWLKNQMDGSEIDMDAWQTFNTERQFYTHQPEPQLYCQLRHQHRDIACFLLADFSLSTDAWVSNEQRVIDVLKDGLVMMAEALSSVRDKFAIAGFWSKKNELVQVTKIKDFEQAYDEKVLASIQGCEPGFYTRLGAAIRYGVKQLIQQGAQQKILLLLSDGKPNDLDAYEGRYGVEDTRHAILEARKSGIIPFCVTIDQMAEDYLPHLFGKQGFVVIQKPEHLPHKLPLLYSQITQLAH